MRMWLTAAMASLAFTSAGFAQAPWQFKFQTGQVLSYKAEQTMTATEVVQGEKSETSQKVNLVKTWKVLAVDAAGVATVQKSLTSLRIEQKTGSGNVLVFDSAAPDKSDKDMTAQLSKFVGVPLAVLRVDTTGRVVEVKECKHGKASQYEAELPFVLLLPPAGMPGQPWSRTFTVTLDPPEGTGEKYEATQTYSLPVPTSPAPPGAGRVIVATAFKSLPAAAADKIPLIQYQPAGEVVFDAKAGKVLSVKLDIVNELKDHQGEGSTYSFKRTYAEQLVGN
jgi:hypothetical protein